MRIVIDMQGAQTDSRYRGIGRYTLSLVKSMVRLRGEHEVLLVLNGHFDETIETIRIAFEGLLEQERIRVWTSPGPVPGACEVEDDWHRKVAERMREDFIASLCPDMVLITSLFEGYMESGVITVRQHRPEIATAVIFYDLIPLLNPEAYLYPNPLFERIYRGKIASLKTAQAWLGISASASDEGRDILDLPAASVFNISTACDEMFRPKQIEPGYKDRFLARFGIKARFLLYAGGSDDRKNLPRLIRAFAALPETSLRNTQLVLAGKMPKDNVENLKRVADEVGLTDAQIRMTGYITDEELHDFYCLAEAFVFPSIHEGFGLPALEAMACGTVVVASNTTSIPEVVGLEEAMFDPFDERAIVDAMHRALSDSAFRARARESGLERAKRFSWDISAEKAWKALETTWGRISKEWRQHDSADFFDATIGALIGCLPAEPPAAQAVLAATLAENLNSGESRQLLVDVSEISQGGGGGGVQRVVQAYLKQLLMNPPRGFRVEPVYAGLGQGYRYARAFTRQFLGKASDGAEDSDLEFMRGDIFFGLDLQHYIQLNHEAFFLDLRAQGVTVKFLVHDLLPIQLPDLFKDPELGRLHADWLRMIARMDGAICVSETTRDAYQSWLEAEKVESSPTFTLEVVHNGADFEGSVPSTGFPFGSEAVLARIGSAISFLSVATLEPRKGQSLLLDALERLWGKGLDVNLVLVGHEGWNVEDLAARIKAHPENGARLFWLEAISDEYLDKVYQASTCLIAASLNEGFGLPLIEAARHGLPVIARDIPVFREVAGACAFYLQGEAAGDWAQGIETWLLLHEKGKHPSTQDLRWSTWAESEEHLKKALITRNYPRRQILVDISALAVFDAKTGIQRVVRNVLRQWLLNPPDGYRIEPIFATDETGYRYARTFCRTFMAWEVGAAHEAADDPIEWAPGDQFFVLDMQPDIQPLYRNFYQRLRGRGVTVKYLVYDILCIEQPEHFAEGVVQTFKAWIDLVLESDGAICISKASADALKDWIGQQPRGEARRSFSLDWSHLGSDIIEVGDDAVSTLDPELLAHLEQLPSFLMVGTLEPRKGHAQVLDAFEVLWERGVSVNLIIVGKPGWLMDAFRDRLAQHPEFEKKLFWLNGLSDKDLSLLYQSSVCLIAGSYGEGFGLPIIEAAHHGTPVLARDLPVFREVAGDHVVYFEASDGAELAKAVEGWLEKKKDGSLPDVAQIPTPDWAWAAAGILKKLLPATSEGSFPSKDSR